MEYRFKFQIVDEDDNEAIVDSTYIIPESVNEYGECENVDVTVARGLRHFRTYLKALAIKNAEYDAEAEA